MSFLTHQNNGLLWLSSSLLDGQPVRHGFSTRLGGRQPRPLGQPEPGHQPGRQ